MAEEDELIVPGKARPYYHISLGFIGHPEPKVYEVSEDDQARFRHINDPDRDFAGSGPTFFGFDIKGTGWTAIVNLRAIKYACLLFDGAIPRETDIPAEMKTTGYTLKLFFIGESKPMEVGLDEPGELFDLETQLEDALEQGRLFGLVDEDGEDFFVNPEQVALIEVPTWLLQDPESADEDEERPIGPEEAD